MSNIRRFLRRLIQAFRPERAETDLAREVASHLALLEDEYQRRGMSPEQAHTEARRAIGGAEQAKIRHRDARSFRWLDELIADVRQAWRTAVRNRRSSLAAILILSAVGSVTALVFGIADAVLFRSLPYGDPDRVLVVRMLHEPSGRKGTLVSNRALQLFSEPGHDISAAGLISDGPRISVDTPDGATTIVTASTTPGYFHVLEVRPVLGRLFSDQDVDAGRHVALLAHDTWRTRFGGEDVVGRTVTLGNTTLDVVGVLPPGLFLPLIFGEVPEVFTATSFPTTTEDNAGTFYPIVRLSRDVTLDRAQAALTARARASRPVESTSIPVLEPVRVVLFPAGQTIMRWLVVCTLVLVVLAAVNLASLLLVRGFGRVRETGVKLALGASRTRIIRPVLLEVLGVSLVGGAVAWLIAWSTFESLLAYVPRITYGNAAVGVNLRVAILTVAIVSVAAVLAALASVWFSTRRNADLLIRSAGGGRSSSSISRRGRVLVAVQVALTVVLVFGAAITARAFVTLLNVPLGFDPTNVMTAGFITSTSSTTTDYEHILRLIDDLPNVEAVGGAARMPFDFSAPDDGIPLPGGQQLGLTYMLPGYFETIRRPLVRGRHVTWDDYRSDPGAVVVSESAAQVLSPGSDALGMSFVNRHGRPLHVVGIVADAQYNVGSEPQASVYGFAVAPERLRRMNIVVRTTHRSDVLLQDLQRQISGQVPAGRIHLAWWADGIFNVTGFRNPRFQTIVLTTLSSVALVLTMVGIIGVMGSLVAARTKELAVRAAIGATPGALVRLVVRQGLVPVTFGVVVGLIATRWAAGFAEAQLFAVDTSGATALVSTALVVCVAALVAALIPARRAGRADPVVALRAE